MFQCIHIFKMRSNKIFFKTEKRMMMRTMKMLIWIMFFMISVSLSRSMTEIPEVQASNVDVKRRLDEGGQLLSIETTFQSFYSVKGVLFDVEIFDNDITIKQIDVHTNSRIDESFEVWSKKGSWQSEDAYDPGTNTINTYYWYMRMCAMTKGQGVNAWTTLPPESMDYIHAEGNSILAIYITLIEDGGNLQVQDALFLPNNGIYASSDLAIMPGASVFYPFVLNKMERVWNGRIFYSFGLQEKEFLLNQECRPSQIPSVIPSVKPSVSLKPSFGPTLEPTSKPSSIPTLRPTVSPSYIPSRTPTFHPSFVPSKTPTSSPTTLPSFKPSKVPTSSPTISPSFKPSKIPTSHPTLPPSSIPSSLPSTIPTLIPSYNPTFITAYPTRIPSHDPSRTHSAPPTMSPSAWPSITDSILPTLTNTIQPTIYPSLFPSARPSHAPSVLPTVLGTFGPTIHMSLKPSLNPTGEPSEFPSFHPSKLPSLRPTTGPSLHPSAGPSFRPSTEPSILPSRHPSLKPSLLHSNIPSIQPSIIPTELPTLVHTNNPSNKPTSFLRPSSRPSVNPTPSPTFYPTLKASSVPSALPTEIPSENPTNILSSAQTANTLALAGVAAASAGAAAAASSQSASSELEGGFRSENENSNNQITSGPDDVTEEARESRKRLQSYRQRSKRFRQEGAVDGDFNGEENDVEFEESVISDTSDSKRRNEEHYSSKVPHASTYSSSHDIPVPVVSVQHQKRRHWLSDLLEEHDEQQTSISSLSSGRRTGSVRLQRKLRSTRSRETSLDVYSNVKRQLSKIIGEDSLNQNMDSRSFSSREEIISNEYGRITRVNDQSIKPRVIHLEMEHIDNPNVSDRYPGGRISEGYSIIE